MDISGLEIRYVISKLNSIVVDYYVNNVYLINDKSSLIKLHHSEKAEVWLVLDTDRGIWITKRDIGKDSGDFATKLKKEILRLKFRRATQPGSERIAILEFGDVPDSRRVILEFFGGGNIIVTDNEGLIRSFLRPLNVRHRVIRMGVHYQLPPNRGIDVTVLDKKYLSSLQESDLEISRWLGRNLSLSKKYVEELMYRAGINSGVEGRNVSEDEVIKLYDSIKKVVEMTSTGDVEPTVVYDNGIPIDATPFKLKAYEGFESKRFNTFMEALDEVLPHNLLSSSIETSFSPLRGKIEELRKSVLQQTAFEKSTKEKALELRVFAEKLRSVAFQAPDLKSLPSETLKGLGASEISIMKGRLSLIISGVVVEADSSGSIMKLSSQIFGESKNLERKLEPIEKAQMKLIREIEKLESKLEEKTSEAQNDKLDVKREKAWYERYRWFRTSEGLLVVFGRDTSTNSIIINKYAEDKDLVFHADLHGSPFLVLKEGTPKNEKSINESAQAVVSFSRAWKDGFSSADAYWVLPDQIKKHAPSGMYLAKGSFLIQGVKNYVKNLKVECAVGVTEIDGNLTVMSGPLDAVRRNSIAYVVIIPDKGKISDLAKKIKADITSLMEKEHFKLSRISLDDFVRALPAGGGRVVSRKIGEQIYTDDSPTAN